MREAQESHMATHPPIDPSSTSNVSRYWWSWARMTSSFGREWDGTCVADMAAFLHGLDGLVR